MTALRRRVAIGAILILAGILTAVLAFAEAASVSACIDLLALWMAQELWRPVRRRPGGTTPRLSESSRAMRVRVRQ